ncbi:MAG: DUF1003 domain-containing protein [Parcubacteria group bacterium]|nr:DUF1003 domain-containing protein [Parcubacteria group bacterium]
MQHTPLSLEALRREHRRVKEIQVSHKPHFRGLDRLALFVTKRVGTMGFFFIIFIWTVGWLSWNVFAPIELRFDPYPAFVLWLFISNMVQLFLLPLIMIGQNLESMHSDMRAEHDFEVNVKTEKEVETILQHLENQQDVLSRILEHVEQKK